MAVAHHSDVSVPKATMAAYIPALRMMFLASELIIPPVALSMDCMSEDPVYTRDITGRNRAKILSISVMSPWR